MAIVENPIIGRARKSFGSAVFSRQFGHNTMRTKPLKVRDPKTPAQMRYRRKFTTLVHLIQRVLPIINAAYGKRLEIMSPFNKIVSLNINSSFVGEPPEIDHTRITFCDIIGSTVSCVTLTARADQAMEVSWKPGTEHPQELSVPLTFILINCSTNNVVIFPDQETRNAGSTLLTVPADWVGTQTALHIVTWDYSQFRDGKPQMIIKNKAGCNATSVVL